MIEAHIESAEQLWRAGEYEHYIPVSPTESDTEPDNETTLVPSHDTSFEDTLTDDNVQAKMEVIQEDINTDEQNGADTRDGIRDGNEKVRDGADIVSTYDTATDGSLTSQEDLDTAREKGASDLDGNEDTVMDGNEVVIEDVEQSFMSLADESMDELFEDCVNDEKKFDRIVENYSLEMKLALGIDNTK